ncbi:MAG TPA: ABC transporter ATP-binding protein [Alphaproteobacteria bacterium]|nr:ABC transporter ATP-binding protein [Alphaproteobacteria bacterium]
MLNVADLALAYTGEPVLERVSFEVTAGQFASLVGPSGSGKSSILRAITGLQKPLSGRVAVDVPPGDVGLLFQDDALLPWRTARENVALGFRLRGKSKAAALADADEWLDRLGLAGFETRYPRNLSGGQRKRVALAQVFALKPRLLLMDEPFASLDAIMRLNITQELLGWVEQERMTVLLVTHDLEEAVSVSDSVYVLSRGPRARIRAHYAVPIPRPRDALESRAHPAFGPLIERLWRDLSDEIGLTARKAA